MQFKQQSIRFLAGCLALSLVACGGSGGEDSAATSEGEESGAAAGGGVSGDVLVDGSSTVFPISEAMAEEFMKANPESRVTVGVSGSGGGFKKFCVGETDVSNASRPIKQSEIDICTENGIDFVELPVAFDGLSVVVSTENNWAACLKPEELGKMWAPDAEGAINNWNQVRSDFPDTELSLYGPGTDSGTYDYFTDATTGEEGESRGDYTASEDDNVIVQGVTSDSGGLGFFGYAYYAENKDKLTVVKIENADGECVAPAEESIADGTYNPLARPIFIYVSTKSLEEKPAVKAFIDFHLAKDNENLISEVGYVPLPADLASKAIDRFGAATPGSIFEGGSSVGVKLSDKL
ncbi:MAG: PstS family phosphate ABC transporter substrate-binding protein [Cyanobacteria bacterium P01_C01_bin.89]